MHTDRPLILTVGGGIGGLAFAAALQGMGLPVIVWERALELREVGAGLLLTPNAVWVLEKLGLAEAARAAGQSSPTWRILDLRGRVLQTFAGRRGESASISIARSAFHDVLRGALPPGILHLDHEALPSRKGLRRMAWRFARRRGTPVPRG